MSIIVDLNLFVHLFKLAFIIIFDFLSIKNRQTKNMFDNSFCFLKFKRIFYCFYVVSLFRDKPKIELVYNRYIYTIVTKNLCFI